MAQPETLDAPSDILVDNDPVALNEATITGMQLEVAHIMNEAVQAGLNTTAGKALVADAQHISRSMTLLRVSDAERVVTTMAFLKALRRARTSDSFAEDQA